MSGLESLRLAAGYSDARNYAPAQSGLVKAKQILLIRFNPPRQANAMTSEGALRALPLKIHPIAPWQIPFLLPYRRVAASSPVYRINKIFCNATTSVRPAFQFDSLAAGELMKGPSHFVAATAVGRSANQTTAQTTPAQCTALPS